MKNNTTRIIIIAVIVGAAAFFGGMKYQESKQPSFGGRFGGNGNGNVMMFGGNRGAGGQGRMMGGNGNGFRPVAGEIISSDDTSITVKMPDGSSKIVILSDKTKINKAAEGSASDLKTGENVAVFGTANSDGSVTAENIQLGGGMFRGMQRGPTPTI